MRPAGQAAIDTAKTNGSWDQLDAAESLEIPADLRRELRRNSPARRNFEALSAWARKRLLGWVHSAKRPATRQRRIARLIERVGVTVATGAEAVYAIIVSAEMRQAADVPRGKEPRVQRNPEARAVGPCQRRAGTASLSPPKPLTVNAVGR